MPVQARKTDICQTCNHVSECAHYRNCQRQEKTIFQCENFDDRPALRVLQGMPADKGNPTAPSASPIVAYVEGRMKGLCVNCETREF